MPGNVGLVAGTCQRDEIGRHEARDDGAFRPQWW
jgi:hypothetical protein